MKNRIPTSILLLAALAIFGFSSFFALILVGTIPKSMATLAYASVAIIMLRHVWLLFRQKSYFRLCYEIVILGVILLLHSKSPYGQWDAWAQWIPKAKFLALDTSSWKLIFSRDIPWMHPDYPLLSPSLVALASKQVAASVANAGIVIGSLFSWIFFLITGDLISNIAKTKKARPLMLIYLLIPAVIPWIASQYIDIALGCFISAIFYSIAYPDLPYRHLFTGLFLGAAIFTKNEGMLYAVVFGFVTLIQNRHSMRGFRSNYPSYLIGLLPGLIAWLYVKFHAPASDVLSQAPLQISTLSAQKISAVLMISAKTLLRPSTYFFYLPTMITASLLFLKQDKVRSQQAVYIAQFLCISFAGFEILYLFSYLPPDYHIPTSIDRLVVQVLPLSICFVASLISSFLKEESIRELR